MRKVLSLLPQCQCLLSLHAGTPCVFYDHFYQEEGGLRKIILELLSVRRRHGLNAR